MELENTASTIQPADQVDIPPAVDSPKPKNNSVLITLSLLLMILVGIVVFLGCQNYQLQKQINLLTATTTVSPTPTATADPTVNWKTYTSPKAGFSLKYPGSLPITASVCGGSCFENLTFTPNPATGGANIAVVLSFKDPRIKTINDYKKIIIKGDSSIINVQTTTIDGDPAISYKLSGGIPPLPIIEYAVVHNGNYYIVRLEDSDETNKDLAGNRKVFDQILSTFKFLPTSSPSPSPVGY